MPHPLAILNQKIWVETLGYLTSSLTAVLFRAQLPESEVRILAAQYHSIIKDHQSQIFESTGQDISEYTGDFVVRPSAGIADEFKAIYFLGVNIAKCLVAYPELKRWHHKAVLGLLDFRLEQPYRANRPALTQRLTHVIDKDLIEHHLGKNGWYLLYKCLYNAAKDTHDQSAKEVL